MYTVSLLNALLYTLLIGLALILAMSCFFWHPLRNYFLLCGTSVFAEIMDCFGNCLFLFL